MKKNKSNVIILCIFIIIILGLVVFGTYALLNSEIYSSGTFNVNVTSKGVDIFSFEKGEDASFKANVYNFGRTKGHNLTASTYINPTLNTTNPSASVCYEMNAILPDEAVFTYSTEERTPELLLTVYKSSDGNSFDKVIDQMDITESFGVINIPVSASAGTFKNVIETTKNKITKQYWKAELTLVHLKDADQIKNDEKTYTLTLQAKYVAC